MDPNSKTVAAAAVGPAAPTSPPTAAGAGRGLPDDAVRVEPAIIVDATGFERPMAAATLFLPHGWTTEGGVYWGREAMCTNGYVISWKATSPDGQSTVAVLPQERWESNNYGAPPSTPGCGLADIRSTEQYLQGLVQRQFPGARIVAIEPREDLRRQFAQLETVVPMPAGDSRTWVDAAQARFTWTQGGRAMAGVVATVTIFNLMRSNYGMGPMDALSAMTNPSWAATGPAETFDPALSEALRRSIQTDPQWGQRINGHNAAIAAVALEESRKRSAMITKSNDEIAAIRQQAWDSYQDSSDRRARQFSEAIRGVQSFDDAAAPTGQVELSNQYDQAWRLNDGSYVLTNDQSFDPWRDLQVEGRKLPATP